MLPTNKMLSASVRKSNVLFRCNCRSINLKHIALSLPYLDSEADTAELHETIDLFKSKPVVVVSSRCSKSITIFRPVLLERHGTSIDPPLHQDPTVDGEYWQSDSRVGAQSSNGRRLVCCFEICTVNGYSTPSSLIVFELRTNITVVWIERLLCVWWTVTPVH